MATYTLAPSGAIQQLMSGAWVPTDPGNADYQDYLNQQASLVIGVPTPMPTVDASPVAISSVVLADQVVP
jgi:hypothetical protein